MRGFKQLLHKKKFVERLISIIFDEAHCISIWASFWKEFSEMGLLCMNILCKDIPFVVASATLPTPVLNDVIDSLWLRTTTGHLEIIPQPSIWPNIHLVVLPICSPLKEYEDLAFVFNGWKPGDAPPPKFLVFFDDISDAVEACRLLQACLPWEFQNKIEWFNSEMSNVFKVDEFVALWQGEMWGFCTTNSFGMVCNIHGLSMQKLTLCLQGMDLPDIQFVVQWQASCNLMTLWQRLGRGTHNRTYTSKAIFLVEKEYFDEERKQKLKCQRLWKAKKKKNSKKQNAPLQLITNKHIQTDSNTSKHVTNDLEGSSGSSKESETVELTLDLVREDENSNKQETDMIVSELHHCYSSTVSVPWKK